MRTSACLVKVLLIHSVGILLVAYDGKLPSAAETNALDVTSVITLGIGGPPRRPEFYPGDIVTISTVFGDLSLDEQRQCNFGCQFELLNAKRQPLLLIPANPQKVHLLCGSQSAKSHAFIVLPNEATPGVYYIRVSANDLNSVRHDVKDYKIEILDPSVFGAKSLRVSRDKFAKTFSASIFASGDTVYVQYTAVGCIPADGIVRVKSTITVMDEKGAKMGEPITFDNQKTAVGDGPEEIPLLFHFFLNRAGKFRIQLVIEDANSDSRATYDIPVAVFDALNIDFESNK